MGWGRQERFAFKDQAEADAQAKKDRKDIAERRVFTALERARIELGHKGIRFDGNMQVADLSYLEEFIRQVVRDEMNQPIPVDGNNRRLRR